jgi:hypothetical protein
VRGDATYVLVDRRDRKPVKPLAFHAHDGRELGPMPDRLPAGPCYATCGRFSCDVPAAAARSAASKCVISTQKR